ncbi:ABC transporter ATP-binding protein [Desulfolutivibrio sulfoxidireducens]|uniref:ABC transporter ATP-binding protein n=1 Tax=Desulfolutivibrio sulfoxidireducens TaxID=2773299 RepID=UPI00159DBC4A|nr:ABC transporter ATP-binding protein [Desulfolutivibrio sulfoxidireducens]QLA14677.1 ATP-binding cassette domain-containing protein [Desulfolutivibrio sulfoxidireducens]QLA18259.1 ATP-binding cassette domain-containing protein [Desulfolutivibrio sulfoxidireducens]
MTMPLDHADQPALVVHHLTKRFRGAPALDDVGFTVPRASLTVILGHAGAGKTTTLRIVAGLTQPDFGQVLLSGRDVAGRQPKDRDVAMIFDNLALYPDKTGFENIASPLRVRGRPRAEIEEKVTAMAGVLRIGHTLKRLPATMSGGERQRIALGRALIRSPRLFLLDEPLSSLDAQLRIELRAELRRLQSEHGYSFLMATPDFNEALAIADTVVMLRQGRVVQIAPPQELYDHPVDRETALSVGAPLINLVDARFDPDASRLLAGGWRLDAPEHLARSLAGGPGAFELGIRPENLVLSDPGRATILGELADIEPLGLNSVLTVKNGQAQVRLVVASSQARGLSLGEPIGLEIANPSMVRAFDLETGHSLTRQVSSRDA